MCTSARHPLTRLPQGATLRIVNGAERVVAVFQGQVWITQDNDPRDFFLGAGESLALDQPGLTVVQAFEDTQLMLLDAEPQAELPSTYQLHRQARAARDAAIGEALAHGAAAAKAVLARAARLLVSRWRASPLHIARHVMPARS